MTDTPDVLIDQFAELSYLRGGVKYDAAREALRARLEAGDAAIKRAAKLEAELKAEHSRTLRAERAIDARLCDLAERTSERDAARAEIERLRMEAQSWIEGRRKSLSKQGITHGHYHADLAELETALASDVGSKAEQDRSFRTVCAINDRYNELCLREAQRDFAYAEVRRKDAALQRIHDVWTLYKQDDSLGKAIVETISQARTALAPKENVDGQ